MRTVPYDVLRILADLPDNQRCQVTLHTNGKGEWKAEVTLFYGDCQTEPTMRLPDMLRTSLETLTKAI